MKLISIFKRISYFIFMGIFPINKIILPLIKFSNYTILFML